MSKTYCFQYSNNLPIINCEKLCTNMNSQFFQTSKFKSTQAPSQDSCEGVARGPCPLLITLSAMCVAHASSTAYSQHLFYRAVQSTGVTSKLVRTGQ